MKYLSYIYFTFLSVKYYTGEKAIFKTGGNSVVVITKL